MGVPTPQCLKTQPSTHIYIAQGETREGTSRSRRPHPQRTLHKDRISQKRCPFIYLFTSPPPQSAASLSRSPISLLGRRPSVAASAQPTPAGDRTRECRRDRLGGRCTVRCRSRRTGEASRPQAHLSRAAARAASAWASAGAGLWAALRKPAATASRWPSFGSRARAKWCVSAGRAGPAARAASRARWRCTSGCSSAASAGSAALRSSVKAFVSPHATSGAERGTCGRARRGVSRSRESQRAAPAEWPQWSCSGVARASEVSACDSARIWRVRCARSPAASRWKLTSVALHRPAAWPAAQRGAKRTASAHRCSGVLLVYAHCQRGTRVSRGRPIADRRRGTRRVRSYTTARPRATGCHAAAKRGPSARATAEAALCEHSCRHSAPTPRSRWRRAYAGRSSGRKRPCMMLCEPTSSERIFQASGWKREKLRHFASCFLLLTSLIQLALRGVDPLGTHLASLAS